MLETKTISRQIDYEETVDVICNKCGESCKDECGMNYEGLIEYKIMGGFGSKLGDGSVYQFYLCEDCLKTMFEGFKHNPYVEDDEDIEYEEDSDEDDIEDEEE